jgi:hypothetical protein
VQEHEGERFPDFREKPELSPVDFQETEPVAPGWLTYSGTYTNHDAATWAPQNFHLTASSPLPSKDRQELNEYTRRELEEYTREARFWFEAVATDSPFGEQDDDTTTPQDVAEVRERSRDEHERYCREIEQSRSSGCEPELCSLIVLETEMISQSRTVVYASVYSTIRHNRRHDWVGDKWVRLQVTGGRVWLGGVVGAKSYGVTGGYTPQIKASGACCVRGEKAISNYRLDAGWRRK